MTLTSTESHSKPRVRRVYSEEEDGEKMLSNSNDLDHAFWQSSHLLCRLISHRLVNGCQLRREVVDHVRTIPINVLKLLARSPL